MSTRSYLYIFAAVQSLSIFIKTEFSDFKITSNHRLQSRSITRFNTTECADLPECLRYCHSSLHCYAVNYHKIGLHVCEHFDRLAFEDRTLIVDHRVTTAYSARQKRKWSVVFRVQKGMGVSGLSIWNFQDPVPYTRGGQPMDSLGTTDDGTFLSEVVTNHWDTVKQARVSMYVAGEEVMFTTFNATDTNTTSWMSPHTILDSKYTNIGQAETSDISLNGITDDRSTRHFNAYKNYGGCDHDQMWFVMTDRVNDSCVGLHGEQFPRLYYSPTSTTISNAEAQSADVFIISVL